MTLILIMIVFLAALYISPLTAVAIWLAVIATWMLSAD